MAMTNETKPNPAEILAKADKLIARQRGRQPVSTTEHAEIRSELLDAARANDQDPIADRLIDKAETLSALAQVAAMNQEEGIRRSRTADINFDPFARGNGRTVHVDGTANWRETPKVSKADLDNLDDGGFRNLGEYLRAIRDAKTGTHYDKRLEPLAGNNKFSDGYGGVLVPERFETEVVMSADEQTPWLAMRRQFEPLNGNAVFPILADRDRSSKKVGNYKLSRTAESDDIDENSVKFQSRKAELHKAAGLVRVTNELIEDSGIGISSMLNELFGRAASLLMALDFLEGTGVSEPLGVTNCGALYTVDKEGSQTADTIVGTNIVKMRERVRVYDSAVWLAHPGTYTQLITAHLAGTNSDTFLYEPGRGADAPSTLLGRPIYFTEAAQLLGDAGDIICVVPKAYAYLRKPMRIDMSMHVGFTTDELMFKQVIRDDGAPLYNSTLTDARGFEQSEFVTLAARA